MTSRTQRQWLICFAISLLFTLIALFSSQIHLGFLGYPLMLVVCTICTAVGVITGDAFRRFVHPDVLTARDSVDMFRQRIFWLIGPQCIGWVIGFLVFDAIMKKLLGSAF